ncbi:MAG: Fur family transcriptional regulator [Vampirovibrionales bacterium]
MTPSSHTHAHGTPTVTRQPLSAVSLELKDRLIGSLRERGLRLTPQRESILDLFLSVPEGEHLSVDEIHQLLQQADAGISLATTYRTLNTLVGMGVLRELDFSEDHKHYELIRDPDSPHHHIICMDCGKTAEFESPEVLALAQRIAVEKNLTLVDVQLKIFAHCNAMVDDQAFNDHDSLKKD